VDVRQRLTRDLVVAIRRGLELEAQLSEEPTSH
jgi:hypothetical protein